jgi:hypothetical protein
MYAFYFPRLLVIILILFYKLIIIIISCSSSSSIYECRKFFFILFVFRLCALVVRVPGYRSRGPGSIAAATRLSEK